MIENHSRREKDGQPIITVKSYAFSVLVDDDQITMTVKNKKNAIALLSLLIFYLRMNVSRR